MAQVTSDFLAALFTTYRTIFEDWFLAASNVNDYTRLTTVFPSNTLTESFNWLGTVPKMQLWTAERTLQAIAQAQTYSLTNSHYESTVEVDRDMIEDDRYMLVRPRIAQLGQEAARYYWEALISTVTSGSSTPCYDGQNFFSTTHSEESSGTQSNLVSGTGTTQTAIQTDFQTARQTMWRYKDNKGRPMQLKGNLVVAPPELEQVFLVLLNSQFYPGGLGATGAATESNPWYHAADLLIDPYLTDTNDWYLLCTTEPIKPFIMTDRKPPEFVALDNPQDARVFMNRSFAYGVDNRFAFGYGLWQMALNIHQ